MKSSPFSDDAASVRLQVTTGSELAEVFLIDRTFALVKRSIGGLECTVPEGVYKVKARVGDAVTEGWYVLRADKETVDLSAELSIASPVPLLGTTRTHEYHEFPAAEQSRDVALALGTGAQIFLCARRWSDIGAPASPPGGRPGPPPLSLHRTDGTTVFDVQESAYAVGEGDAMLGIAAEVDPGAYVVRWRTSSGVLAEQTVVAIADWQTQVFLLEERPQVDRRSAVGEDPLEGISVQMTRGSFNPNDPMLRVSEEARLALASERKVASQFINDSLFAKFENPMTGLFGAHLMLLAREVEVDVSKEKARRGSDVKRLRAPVDFDQGLFDHVVDNLADLLGPEHPDVSALATKAANKQLSELSPVAIPPMLWRSWLLLIEASNERPELVPVATWQKTLRLLPVRPFLVWSPEEGEAAVETWRREVAPLVDASKKPRRAHGLEPAPAAAMEESTSLDYEETRRLSMQLLAPRAALDELSDDTPG